jgi:hypothetical protein
MLEKLPVELRVLQVLKDLKEIRVLRAAKAMLALQDHKVLQAFQVL